MTTDHTAPNSPQHPTPSASLAEMIRAHHEHPRREMVYPDPTPEPVEHIVDGFWETVVIGRLFRLTPRRFRRAPRALCGVVLWGDPDQPDLPPYPHTPYCPACLKISGHSPDAIAAGFEHVPGYRI